MWKAWLAKSDLRLPVGNGKGVFGNAGRTCFMKTENFYDNARSPSLDPTARDYCNQQERSSHSTLRLHLM